MEKNSDLNLDEEIENSMEGKFLIFRIGDDEYGIAIRNVIEIIGIQGIAELPNMPVYIKGVTNLRGKVIPVVDMRQRFNLQEKEYDDYTCIVVVKIRDFVIGLIVDSLSDVQDIDEEKIENTSEVHKSDETQYIKGLGKVGNSIKILLDIQNLLSHDDLEDISQIN